MKPDEVPWYESILDSGWNGVVLALILGAAIALWRWSKKKTAPGTSNGALTAAKNHADFIFLGVVGLVLTIWLFDQIEASLDWIGISWKTLLAIFAVIALFVGAKHFKKNGKLVLAMPLAGVAVIATVGLVHQLLADPDTVTGSSAAYAAEVTNESSLAAAMSAHESCQGSDVPPTLVLATPFPISGDCQLVVISRENLGAVRWGLLSAGGTRLSSQNRIIRLDDSYPGYYSYRLVLSPELAASGRDYHLFFYREGDDQLAIEQAVRNIL